MTSFRSRGRGNNRKSYPIRVSGKKRPSIKAYMKVHELDYDGDEELQGHYPTYVDFSNDLHAHMLHNILPINGDKFDVSWEYKFYRRGTHQTVQVNASDISWYQGADFVITAKDRKGGLGYVIDGNVRKDGKGWSFTGIGRFT